MDIHTLAALGAALCWSVGPFLAFGLAARMGGFVYNRVRMILASLFLAPIGLGYGLYSGALGMMTTEAWVLTIISGFIGIFIGDSALFMSLRRVGPRRNQIIFSSHAPMTAVMGVVFLSETLTLRVSIGIVVIIIGVIMAVWFGGLRRTQLPAYQLPQSSATKLHTRSHWEDISGPVLVGVGLGLLAALCQAIGSIIIRPVMLAGHDTIVVTSIRVIVGGIAYACTLPIKSSLTSPITPLSWQLLWQCFLTALIGLVIGMGLYVFALAGESAGVAATVSATAPALMLPIIWVFTKKAPKLAAWIGALLVVIGTSLF